MNLFDASALLCYLQGEHGCDVVEDALAQGGVVTAVNWSETNQKVRSAGGDWALARGLLFSYDLDVGSVGMADGEAAAQMWRRGSGLSLADRLCLAVADRLDGVVWTADAAWGSSERIRQVR